MKKVGIVTWYWGNYGSILQAYALQKAIDKLGYDCETIQHNVNGSNKLKILYRLKQIGLAKTFKYYFDKVTSKIREKNNVDYHNILKREETLDKFVKNTLKLSSVKYTNDNFVNCDGYDAFICGSDQIWNPNLTFLSDFYWLNFVKDKIKISYAPSIGSKGIPNSYKEKVKYMLSDFKTITVREKASENILKDIVPNKDIVTVLDPTMLLEKDYWESLLPSRSIESDYIFVYLLRANEEQLNYVNDIAKKLGLKVVIYPLLERTNHCEAEYVCGDYRIYDDTPFDFLEKIKNAKLVITDSFHCSVFSIIFHKNFFVLKKSNDKDGQLVRVTNLLDLTEQNFRLIDVNTDIEKVEVKNSFAKSDIIIEQKRKECLELLKNSLN